MSKTTWVLGIVITATCYNVLGLAAGLVAALAVVCANSIVERKKLG
jgi:hypothetical protein